MKTNITLFITLLMAFVSCEDDNNNDLSNITEQSSTGAVVEIVSTTNNSISSETEEGSLETTLEYRDGENGTLLSQMNVYLTFFDNSTSEGDSSQAIVNQEVALSTIDASAFEIGVNGFPVYNLNISASEFYDATNNTAESTAASDIFTTRFELVLTDGRIFSSTNTGANGGLNSDFTINTVIE